MSTHTTILITQDSQAYFQKLNCTGFVVEIEVKVVHIFREVTRCADILVYMGSKQKEQQVRMLIYPNEVVEEMFCDLRGVTYGRGTQSYLACPSLYFLFFVLLLFPVCFFSFPSVTEKIKNLIARQNDILQSCSLEQFFIGYVKK